MSLKKSFLGRTASRTLAISKSLRAKDATEEVEDEAAGSLSIEGDSWGALCADLLGEVIRRVEASENRWPGRRSVVACACVCRRWREVAKEVVGSLGRSDKITFPSCLKQPGPRDPSQQCLVRRDKKNATFYLFLSLSPVYTGTGKFLLAAKRCRHGAQTEYIISMDANDISQGSNAYVGKLRSDFLGTSFTIYDSQPPHNGMRHSKSKSSRRVASKQISPQVPAGNFEVGYVSYKFNLLKSRGPRRMACAVKFPQSDKNTKHQLEDTSKGKRPDSSSNNSTILSNKTPRWHEHLQCWCLNFHGRVTVASVKNFQLVATVDPTQPGAKGDEETVLLQFGKVAADAFTMDYRQPLSAFQAFAICLTSFGTKLACE